MSRKVRLLLFISLALGFVIATPLVIIYSQGYRFDWERFRLVQTGSFYLRIAPRGVKITISPEHKESPLIQRDTNFLFETSYIENILPGNYNLVVSKEGYHSWRKKLEIQEKRVTKANNIVLMPKNPGFTIVNKNTSAIFPISNDSRIITKESTDNGGWSLLLRDLTRDLSTILISSEKVSGKPINIQSFPEKRKLLINMGEYYLLIDLISGIQHQIKDIESPILDPIRPNSVIHLDGNILLSYNYAEEKSLILANDIRAFGVRENGNIVWLSILGFLFENGNPVKSENFTIKDNVNYRIFLPNQSEIIIAENEIFYLLDRYTSSFREVFRSNREPLTSPDRRKVAHFSNHEIQVFYLNDVVDQPIKSYGENSFLTRFSRTIGNVNWLTNDYIIFTIGDKIKVIEIDDRDYINIVDLAEMSNPYIYFNRLSGRAYIVSDGNLFLSDVLIP